MMKIMTKTKTNLDADQALKKRVKKDLKKALFEDAEYKLVLIDGTSYKYYRINYYHEWDSYYYAYGKIGTTGVEGEKEFNNPEEAVREATKLYKSKLKKGYVTKADYFKKPLKNFLLQQRKKLLRNLIYF